MAEVARPRARRRSTSTVRFRVTALASLAVFLVLVGAGIALLVAQRALLVDRLDESLQERFDNLAGVVAAGELPSTIPSLLDDDDVIHVVTMDGEVIAASGNIEGAAPIGELATRDEDRVPRTVDDLSEEGPFRVLSATIDGPGGDVVVAHVGANLDDIEETLGALRTSLVVAVPLVTAALAGLVWWLVGRTLHPVEAMRAEVADIGGSDLHRRVSEPGGDDEIARLARTMNGMLERLASSVRRQQRFVADASHELRSPLTRMRTELEVDLAHPSTADPEATHRSVLEETVELQHLVDDLLELARHDAGAMPPRREPVELSAIVRGQLARIVSDHVSVDTSGIGRAVVTGDRDQLARAVGNVLENAVRHATHTVRVLVGVDEDGTAVVEITDDGPGIPLDQQELIFERFTRLDDARSADGGGSGLGLAIARATVERHGGTIRVEPTVGPGARFVVRLPAAARPPDG